MAREGEAAVAAGKGPWVPGDSKGIYDYKYTSGQKEICITEASSLRVIQEESNESLFKEKKKE